MPGFKAGTVVANETSIFFHPNFSASDSFAMKIVLLRCAVAFQPNCFVCLCFGFLWVDPTTAKQRAQIVLNAPFYVRAINMPWKCIACGCLNNCITGFSKIHFTTRAMEQSASAAILWRHNGELLFGLKIYRFAFFFPASKAHGHLQHGETSYYINSSMCFRAGNCKTMVRLRPLFQSGTKPSGRLETLSAEIFCSGKSWVISGDLHLENAQNLTAQKVRSIQDSP